MAEVTIYGKHLTKPEIDAVKTLVAEAACGDGGIVVVDAIKPGPHTSSDPIVLVLGNPATCSDPELEANLMRAHQAAQRVIWVWPNSTVTTELPSAAAKYGYSYVPWDPQKLAAVAADDDVTCFETATGVKVPSVPTERNLCVDDEEVDENKKKVEGK